MVARIIKLAFVASLCAVGYKLLFSHSFNEQQSEENIKTENGWESSAFYSEPEVIKVTDHVYVAVGYTIANMIMIEGTEGIIIVDSGESEESCLKVFEEFRKITTKPLKAIIISHFHADHILGASYLLEANKYNGEEIEIIMHSKTAHELEKYKISTRIGFTRMSRQFGVFFKGKQNVKNFSKTNEPDFKIKPEAYNQIISPTITFDHEVKLEIAGLSLTLIHTPGETNDHVTVWIPEWRVVMPGDNIYNYFPNIYPIRGSPLRDCQVWYQSLDKVRHLRPEYMIPMHDKPTIGEKTISDTITHYRDALQFVFDQTIRWMNKGLDVDEIVEKVHLPPVLQSHPSLRQFYGKVSWSVRSVFSTQLGWFGGDPVYLNPLSKKKRARKMAELISQEFPSTATGVERLLLQSKKILDESKINFDSTGKFVTDDLQWGLEIASEALQASDISSSLHFEAKTVTASALKLLAKSTSNYNERNYYLTYAAELEGSLKISLPEERKRRAIESAKVEDILSRFQHRFNAESCDDQEIMTIIFEFLDINQTFCYIMRHCILEFVNDMSMMPSEFDAKLIVTTKLWKGIITGKESVVIAYARGDLAIEGSMFTFRRFMNLIDRD